MVSPKFEKNKKTPDPDRCSTYKRNIDNFFIFGDGGSCFRYVCEVPESVCAVFYPHDVGVEIFTV